MSWMCLLSLVVTLPSEPPRNPHADEFANILHNALEQIRSGYVRELPMNTLAEASLEGLFRAGRTGIPDDLRRELRRARQSAEFTRIYAEAYMRLGKTNPDDLQLLLRLSLSGTVNVLDPACGFSAGIEFHRLATNSDPSFGFDLDGISDSQRGLLVRSGFRRAPDAPPLEPAAPFPWRVRTVLPGSPAQQAGLRPGDEIIAFAGNTITRENSGNLVQRLYSLGQGGPSTHPVAFRIRRCEADKESTVDLEIEPRPFEPETIYGLSRKPRRGWDHWLEPDEKLGYVRLGHIEHQSPGQLREVLQQLESGGMRGLVLDLRWCPGGYLNEAAEIAGFFLRKGLIAKMQYRNPEQRQGRDSYQAEDDTGIRWKAGTYPLVVLVNERTTGGGELIAAALQDHKRATVVGERTFGKSTIQWNISLDNITEPYRLSGGRFFRPNGHELQRFPDSQEEDDWGVCPDPGCRSFLSKETAALLHEWYVRQTLRPNNGREVLPLDDPDADPQRQKAQRILRRLIAGAK